MATAAALGALTLVLIGVALGTLPTGASSGAARPTQSRSALAKSSVRDAALPLRAAEADLTDTRNALRRSERRSRKLARRNAQLQRAVQKARRAVQSERRRQRTRSSGEG